MLDLIVKCKRGAIGIEQGAATLQAALERHLTLHVTAYGEDLVRPKHHWLYHVAPQFQRDGVILDTFVVERGHLLVKRIAEHNKNTSCYESSVMAGVINQMFKNASVSNLCSGLRGGIAMWDGLPVSNQMVVLGLQVAAGDIVFCSGSAGQVLACLSDGDRLYALVDEMTCVEASNLPSCQPQLLQGHFYHRCHCHCSCHCMQIRLPPALLLIMVTITG